AGSTLRGRPLRRVETVDVVEKLHVAVARWPGGEIHNVDRYLLFQRDVFLLAGIHRLLDPGIGPFRLVAQDVPRQLFRALQTNAAVTEGPASSREQAVGRRVVQV